MYNKFIKRHIGNSDNQVNEMLSLIDYNDLDSLIDDTIPFSIRLKKKLNLDVEMTENEYINHILQLSNENIVANNFIGMGYYGSETPSVILRNIFENPSWYTSYTPYQAEISQGRLESLLNFQTVISELTGLPFANASLLDEGTAAAEAMIMLYNSRSRIEIKENKNKFFVSQDCFPQTIAVLRTRAKALNITLVIDNHHNSQIDDSYFGAIVQYPNKKGEIYDYTDFADLLKQYNSKLVIIADILSLAILKEPAKMGVEIAVGSTQRLGIPMGFGGPHAAYFACSDEFKRKLPGRIIGVSKDKLGKKAYRMSIQTREQHIRREKATSNICTAQALLANMAAMYAIYHGKIGLESIAKNIYFKTNFLKQSLINSSINVLTKNHFDTLLIQVDNIEEIKNKAEEKLYNFYYENDYVYLSVDQISTWDNIFDIIDIFRADKINNFENEEIILKRDSDFLQQEVFNKYHTETKMMRYIKQLEKKDISLTESMISLGSCTMKLNAATQLIPLSWSRFANIHPFAPNNQTIGYQKMISKLESQLVEITGLSAISLQPNSGAQGEYAGLLVIKKYLESIGQAHRNLVLIPSSAHGTNPASAVMAGYEIILVKCDEKGNVDVEDLKLKCEKHSQNIAALMITYPSTHGVFEEEILNITELVHSIGAQVYMDGANMNAQVGLTSPASIGADVCHLNLHKTFAIPHGGGGPGVGPIAVAKHLENFLPSNPIMNINPKGIEAISSAPYGSALVLLISYSYICMLGSDGLEKVTKHAILNANYMKSRLQPHFDILYTGNKGNVAHELILDCRKFQKDFDIKVVDIAKRLIDYGFHAPTVSFPVVETLMIEPTESESKEELDKFCDALISIKNEITENWENNVSDHNNILKNAPHTMDLLKSDWTYSYNFNKAFFPNSDSNTKYWPSVSRIDEVYGDQNLICTCGKVEDYINS